jgi:hypothetical protein
MTELSVHELRRLQKDLAGRVFAPADAAFDLLADTGTTLQRQAEALEAAGRALEETARLVRIQAELFERTVGTLRQPAELARAAAGLERHARD